MVESDRTEACANELAHRVANSLHHAAHEAVTALVHNDLDGRDIAVGVDDAEGVNLDRAVLQLNAIHEGPLDAGLNLAVQTHPKYEIRKTYVARLHGEVKPGVKRTLVNGIELEDGPIKVDSFRIVDTYGDITTVEIVVHEGRNRLVRRMMEAVGYPVRELVRTGFGPITLDHLKQGTTRRVKGNALSALYGAVGL